MLMFDAAKGNVVLAKSGSQLMELSNLVIFRVNINTEIITTMSGKAKTFPQKGLY